ncbi:hypothetical protein GYMLUDRAFT_225109 [Collybiopsis luxurians FD-317 M1]|uniref:adenylate cyclase n=1 Tax=Collybiopsis luxurians FD-317 M1 TaxID=944289 RepID=A0A0D0CFR1_9AGAR|nr:hypothetical protein GYMLUDRAFT_225109 [Collybiopsis luxurians FD-317 M1]
MPGSELREVVEVDATGQISIPKIDLNVDAAKGRRSNDSKLEGALSGAHLGDVTPWTEPPSPLLITPPTKRSLGITGLGKVPFFSLRPDARESKDSGFSHSHPSNASESTSTFTYQNSNSSYLYSNSSYSQSRASSTEYSLRKAKSSPGLNLNSRPSLPGSSSLASSGAGVARSILSPLSRLIGRKGKSRLKTAVPAGIPPLKDVEDVLMELDLNLDRMEGIVDPSVLNSSSANGTHIGKGSSITQSISDDTRTVIPEQNQDLNAAVPSNPNSDHGLHGGPDGDGVIDGSPSTANNSVNPDSEAQPPSWIPFESWNVELADSSDQETEEEYDSSSEDNMSHHEEPHMLKMSGSQSLGYGPGRPGGTARGGRPIVFAQPSSLDSDDDDLVEVDELRRQFSYHLQRKVGNGRRQDTSSRFSIRIYIANNMYRHAHFGLNVTVAKLTSKLNAKLELGEEREATYRLYLMERGRERILGQRERPADIIRRRSEQAGYDLSDSLELLGEDRSGFLMKFTYKSQVFGVMEQSILIEDYEHVDLSGHSLRTIPPALHRHADQIISLSLSRNPMLNLPLDFVQSSTSLTELILSHMALKKVPANLHSAVSLTHLDLSSNRIGDLDNVYLAAIPGLRVLEVQNNQMEKLLWHLPKSLTTLNISNNKFRFLPTVVCQLENLRDLDISFNNVAELPEDLGKLCNLEHLTMVGNRITSIPSTASSLVSLKCLDCRQNRIGDLAVIGMLPKLERLFADHNSLCGIHLCLGPCLMMIDASHNKITEMRPVPGYPYTALLSLDISHSELSSVSPLVLSSLPSLRQLNLSHNNIKSLPSALGDLEHLKVLSIAENMLERLPEGIGRLKRLEVLDVRNNNLTELPGELWTCASLVKLNATCNSIEKWYPFPGLDNGSTLSIVNPVNPSSPYYLPSLAYALEKLYLGENQLTTRALGFLSLFQKLKVLNLSFNLIQDLPPTFFKNFLSNIDTASRSYSTPLSARARNQMPKSFLEELYLSGNKLTMLPTEDIARMTKLKTLYLNGNRLQTLPQQLGQVVNLTILDVGSNLLKYNISNWEFDWNWNFNKNLKYLNLSGNKQLQIKSDMKLLGISRGSRMAPAASAAVVHPQLLSGFTELTKLRVLGLINVPITTGQIPGGHELWLVRTSKSTICGMAYGIADTLGQGNHLNVFDLVHEFPGRNKAIFAMFSQSQPLKATPVEISGNQIAKFLRDKYIDTFTNQLSAVRKNGSEGITDALRRSFLKLNQNLHDTLFSNGKQMPSAFPNGAMHRSREDIHNAFVSRGGVSGVVLYFQDKTMYVANAGNALAVISRGGNAEPISRKHDPYDRQEVSRIRAAEGWISPAGLVNNEIDISRSFGFFHLLPVINARPDIFTWQISELDEFVIIGNQGLWDFVSYETAVDIVGKERGDPMLAAQKLRDLVMSYGADGSTMIMVISVSDLLKEERARSREGSVIDPQVWKPGEAVQPFQIPSQLGNHIQHSDYHGQKPKPNNHSNLVSLSAGDSPVFLILQQVLCNTSLGPPPVKDLAWIRDLLASHDKSVLQELADFIQSELDSPSSFDFLNPGEELSREVLDRRCLRTLRYLSTSNYHILPSSLTVTEIRQDGYHPVAGGGFADIWRGSMGDQSVCLKVLRLVVEQDEEVRKNLRRRF